MNPLPIIYGVVGLALVSAVGGYIWHCESIKTEYVEFKAGVAALGKAAKDRADKKEADDKTAKEKADAENKRTIAELRANIKRLRVTRSGGGSMSANPAGSGCPAGQTCFDTALYQRADGAFVTGARELADEGSEIAVDLSTAQRWAQETRP